MTKIAYTIPHWEHIKHSLPPRTKKQRDQSRSYENHRQKLFAYAHQYGAHMVLAKNLKREMKLTDFMALFPKRTTAYGTKVCQRLNAKVATCHYNTRDKEKFGGVSISWREAKALRCENAKLEAEKAE